MEGFEKIEAAKILGSMPQLSQKLSVFEKILQGFPCSEAAVERGFSHHKAIHSKFRAKTGNELVEKFSPSERSTEHHRHVRILLKTLENLKATWRIMND